MAKNLSKHVRKGPHADKRIERTVTYLLRCPASTVPEAMHDDEATTTPLVFVYPSQGPVASPAAASRCTATFLCHINNVGDGEGDESGRRGGAQRVTAREARAMATVMRVVDDEEGEGDKAMVTATRVAG